MKNSILYFALLLTILTSCEDVIDVNLENSPPKIVIEAILTDDTLHCSASLFQSQDFYKSTEYLKIKNAIVKISDDKQIDYILAESHPGNYSSRTITGVPNTNYTFQVEYGNTIYKASSRMPTKVELDSLEYEWVKNPHGQGYNIVVNFNDPKGEKNFYRFKIYRGNKIDIDESGAEIIVWDDKIFDGKKVRLPVRRGKNFFHTGDTVRIDMYSTDDKNYNYFLTLKNAISSGSSMTNIGRGMMEGSSAPANPITNIDNGALGYFAAVAVSSKTIIIK